jgi:hypothetical protein
MNFKACGSGCPIFRLGTPWGTVWPHLTESPCHLKLSKLFRIRFIFGSWRTDIVVQCDWEEIILEKQVHTYSWGTWLNIWFSRWKIYCCVIWAVNSVIVLACMCTHAHIHTHTLGCAGSSLMVYVISLGMIHWLKYATLRSM